MPRKKMTHSKMDKSSVVVSKNSKKKSALPLQTQSLEKDLKEMSLQLANQFRNDLALLKEKEKTLAVTIKKLNSQHKTTKKNYSTLSKAKKTSPATKKQLKELKQNAVQLTKTIKNLDAELIKVKKQKNLLSIKQINFTTLSKQIAKFDKVSKAKPAKKTKLLKKKQKKITKVSKKPASLEQTQTIKPFLQDTESAAYTFETPVDSQMETEEVK